MTRRAIVGVAAVCLYASLLTLYTSLQDPPFDLGALWYILAFPVSYPAALIAFGIEMGTGTEAAPRLFLTAAVAGQYIVVVGALILWLRFRRKRSAHQGIGLPPR